MSKFKKELRKLINEKSKENESNTPDFILTTYLIDCLKTFNKAIVQRESFYGRSMNPDVKYLEPDAKATD
jgi:hypothetical protein